MSTLKRVMTGPTMRAPRSKWVGFALEHRPVAQAGGRTQETALRDSPADADDWVAGQQGLPGCARFFPGATLPLCL